MPRSIEPARVRAQLAYYRGKGYSAAQIAGLTGWDEAYVRQVMDDYAGPRGARRIRQEVDRAKGRYRGQQELDL